MKTVNLKSKISFFYPLLAIAFAILVTESFCGQHFFERGVFFYLLNLFVYAFIYFLTYLVSGKIKLSGVVTFAFPSVFSFINYYICSFRGNPIMAADFFSLGTAADVASHYSIDFPSNVIKCVFLFAVFLGILLIIRVDENLTLPALVRNRVFSFIYVLVFIWFFFISAYPADMSLFDFDGGIQNVYDNQGIMPGFVLSIRKLQVKPPVGYSPEKVSQITKSYKEKDEKPIANRNVNLIVIVDESFADIMRNHPDYISKDNMPFLHSLKDNLITGTLVSSIYGGNTANSEFEFLTGFSMAFEPYGMVSFQNIDKKLPSINHSLVTDGYAGMYGLHPGKPDSWRRDVVYPYLGFEKFLTKDDFMNQDTLRGFVSDKSMLRETYDIYKEQINAGEPVYIYGMTIQNHGGYETKDDSLIYDIDITNSELLNDKKLLQYINLVKETDEAVEEFIVKLQSENEPVMVLFFGDHLPGMERNTIDIISDGNSEFKYESPFYLWANFDIEEKNIGKISMNYLGAYMLSQAGAGLSPYEQYLLDMYNDIPVLTMNGYIGSDGKRYSLKDRTSPYYDKIIEYEMLQYNAVYDDNTDMKFFYISD